MTLIGSTFNCFCANEVVRGLGLSRRDAKSAEKRKG